MGTDLPAPERRGKASITIRLTDEQRARLDAASKLGPYTISLTEIVARGIELAAQEIEAMARRSKGGEDE